MNQLNSHEINTISGGSVYVSEDAIVWNRMPTMVMPGEKYFSSSDLATIKLLQILTGKPVMEVW